MSFNQAIDDSFVKPVTQAYRYDLLQGKRGMAATHTGCVAINSTFGLFGLLDLATRMGLEWRREDFGQTLGVWGMGSGPCLVLPLLGPSSIQTGVSRPTGGMTDTFCDHLGPTVPPSIGVGDLCHELFIAAGIGIVSRPPATRTALPAYKPGRPPSEERLRLLRELFLRRKVVTTDQLLSALNVSVATVKRDLDFARDRLNWKISAWRRGEGGYALEDDGSSLELSGLCFSDAEILALLTMQHLMRSLEPGFLQDRLAPLHDRLRGLIEGNGHRSDEIERRVKIIHIGRRRARPEYFQVLADALLRRRRVVIEYWNRERNDMTKREISPQQLVHYRENWVLDAWCHMRRKIRTFALDAVRSVQASAQPAKEVDPARLTKHFEASYGIYSGPARHTARLKFTPERARYVALEEWHPGERRRFLADGSYVLEVPYGDDRELVMDLLRHGQEVQVLAPASLRQKVAQAHRDAASRYGR